MRISQNMGNHAAKPALECGLALLIGWTARRWTKFYRAVDGDVLRLWDEKRANLDGEPYEFLTARQKEQLHSLRKDGADALARRVADWPGKVIVYGHNEYPTLFSELEKPPAAIHIRGDPRLLEKAGLAVVGSRKIGVRDGSTARRILEPAVSKGMVVISGGALGSDALAHRCAVDLGGKTIAVLPSGLRTLSPRTNRRLFGEIVSGTGVLISEYPPDQGVRRYHFRRRNLLIAALSRGVLVLRAGEKSGTMLTVDAARQLGRPLAAMPGRNDVDRRCGPSTGSPIGCDARPARRSTEPGMS